MEARDDREALMLIQRCADYRTLRGKRDDLGLALSPVDRERLDELERFFSSRQTQPGSPEYARRDHERHRVRLVVQYSAPDGARTAGVLRDVSGEGVYLETHLPLEAGQRTIVRVLDRDRGHEWRLGATVVWVRRGHGMGLRLVGIPLEVRLGHAPRKRPHRRAA